jgi:hypothetical protein
MTRTEARKKVFYKLGMYFSDMMTFERGPLWTPEQALAREHQLEEQFTLMMDEYDAERLLERIKGES